MTCPSCGSTDIMVTETRPARINGIERRRRCDGCGLRFMTGERVIQIGSLNPISGVNATPDVGLNSGESDPKSGVTDVITTPHLGIGLGGVGGVLSPDSVSGPGPEVRTLSQQSERSHNVMGPRRRRKKVPYTAEFLAFWAAYPRKVKKPLAAIAWLDEKPDLTEVLAALAWQCLTPEWRKEGGQFVPHPATYINQRRWEDEESATPILSAKEALNHQAGRNVLERVKQLGLGSGK